MTKGYKDKTKSVDIEFYFNTKYRPSLIEITLNNLLKKHSEKPSSSEKSFAFWYEWGKTGWQKIARCMPIKEEGKEHNFENFYIRHESSISNKKGEYLVYYRDVRIGFGNYIPIKDFAIQLEERNRGGEYITIENSSATKPYYKKPLRENCLTGINTFSGLDLDMRRKRNVVVYLETPFTDSLSSDYEKLKEQALFKDNFIRERISLHGDKNINNKELKQLLEHICEQFCIGNI